MSTCDTMFSPRVPNAAGKMYSAIDSSDEKTRSSASEGVACASRASARSRKMSAPASTISSRPKASTVVLENSRRTNSVTKIAAGSTSEHSTSPQKRTSVKIVASESRCMGRALRAGGGSAAPKAHWATGGALQFVRWVKHR